MTTQKLPDSMMIGDDGALYRVGQWDRPIRPNYARHCRSIETVADLKACLRAGDFAWPGGYALYYLTADGAALSPAAVRREFRLIADAIRRDDTRRGGWRVVGMDTVANCDEPVICDHTGKTIE